MSEFFDASLISDSVAESHGHRDTTARDLPLMKDLRGDVPGVRSTEFFAKFAI